MPDLILPELARHLADPEPMPTRLPFTTRAGDTVSVANGRIYLNARPLRPVDALDLSAALARAVTETVLPNHTTERRSAA